MNFALSFTLYKLDYYFMIFQYQTYFHFLSILIHLLSFYGTFNATQFHLLLFIEFTGRLPTDTSKHFDLS